MINKAVRNTGAITRTFSECFKTSQIYRFTEVFSFSMVSGYFSYNDVVSHSYYTLSYCEDHEDYKYFSFLSVERMSINIPIGISITPKNMANDLKIG